MYAAVTIIRAPDGRVLERPEWPAPLVGELRITQYRSPSAPRKRATMEANLYADYGTGSMRTLASISNVTVLPDENGDLQLDGIIREHREGKLYEHRQIWVCRMLPSP